MEIQHCKNTHALVKQYIHTLEFQGTLQSISNAISENQHFTVNDISTRAHALHIRLSIHGK